MPAISPDNLAIGVLSQSEVVGVPCLVTAVGGRYRLYTSQQTSATTKIWDDSCLWGILYQQGVGAGFGKEGFEDDVPFAVLGQNKGG